MHRTSLCRLVKAGLLPNTLGRRLVRLSATGELVGYSASIVLNGLRILALLEREALLRGELQRRIKVCGRKLGIDGRKGFLFGGREESALMRDGLQQLTLQGLGVLV